MVGRSVVIAVPGTAGALAEDWFLTAANWLVKLAAFAWVIQVFSEERYVVSLVGAIAGELSAILPVNGLAGLGTYEAAVVGATRFFDVAGEAALTGAVNLHFLVLGTSILSAGCALLVPGTPVRATNVQVDRVAEPTSRARP